MLLTLVLSFTLDWYNNNDNLLVVGFKYYISPVADVVLYYQHVTCVFTVRLIPSKSRGKSRDRNDVGVY